jgi:hypothetical protein
MRRCHAPDSSGLDLVRRINISIPWVEPVGAIRRRVDTSTPLRDLFLGQYDFSFIQNDWRDNQALA